MTRRGGSAALKTALSYRRAWTDAVAVRESFAGTCAVLERHLRLRRAGELDRDLAESYWPDVVVLTRSDVHRGIDAVREQADVLHRYTHPSDYRYSALVVAGPIGCQEWEEVGTERAEIAHGADSYLVLRGRILAQTIHYPPRTAERWPDRRPCGGDESG